MQNRQRTKYMQDFSNKYKKRVISNHKRALNPKKVGVFLVAKIG
jgi:hypothetical protein